MRRKEDEEEKKDRVRRIAHKAVHGTGGRSVSPRSSVGKIDKPKTQHIDATTNNFYSNRSCFFK